MSERLSDEALDAIEETGIVLAEEAPLLVAEVREARRASAPRDEGTGRAAGPAPIHWLGDATQDADVWELTRRRDRFTILGGPTTLHFAMDDGTRIVVPSGWWLYDWNTPHPYVSSAAPSPSAQGDREEPPT